MSEAHRHSPARRDPPWLIGVLIAVAVTVAVYAAAVLALMIAGRREDARALATFIPDCIVLVTRLARDPRHVGGERVGG